MTGAGGCNGGIVYPGYQDKEHGWQDTTGRSSKKTFYLHAAYKGALFLLGYLGPIA
jgi:hypothetical protein